MVPILQGRGKVSDLSKVIFSWLQIQLPDFPLTVKNCSSVFQRDYLLTCDTHFFFTFSRASDNAKCSGPFVDCINFNEEWAMSGFPERGLWIRVDDDSWLWVMALTRPWTLIPETGNELDDVTRILNPTCCSRSENWMTSLNCLHALYLSISFPHQCNPCFTCCGLPGKIFLSKSRFH